MILFLLFGIILTQNCQYGIKRGDKFCACYSGYSGAFCENPPTTNITAEKAPIRVSYENKMDPKTSEVNNYLLTVKQQISPTRKQSTIISGKNFNCNYPQSPYWTQSTDGKDDIFQIDMTVYKKYKCVMNDVKYYESSSINEIVVSNPTLTPQITKISQYNVYSQTDNLAYIVVNTTLTTSSVYPAYLTSPSLGTIDMISNCKPGDTVCKQTWDITTVCGLTNPYSLVMTMNCRASDPSCVSQSLINIMILYNEICLLQKIPFNLFTYEDSLFKKPKNSYSRGDKIYVNVQLEQCNYQITGVQLNDDALLSSYLSTNYGNSLSYTSYSSGFEFIMPSNSRQTLIVNIYITCPDGTSAQRKTSIIIQGNGGKNNVSFTMFFVTMMIVYFLFFLMIVIHMIRRQMRGALHYVLFSFVIAFMISKFICYGFYIGYLYTSQITLIMFYYSIHSIASALFLTIVSLNIEIIEREVISRKTILSIIALISIVFITIHICITIFDLIVIIFFTQDVYYNTISSIIATLMVLVSLIILAYLLFKATSKNRSFGKDLPKLIVAKFILLISAAAKITYLSLCIYASFVIVDLQWIEIFNFIHEITFLCLLPILF